MPLDVFQDVSSGLMRALITVLIGETLCYLVHGRRLRNQYGDYGLVTYIHSSKATIYTVISVWNMIDIFYYFMGSFNSPVELLTKIVACWWYPFFLEQIIGLIWGLEDE